ncbi:MAG: nitrogen regulation protein NR(II), partial [Nitrospinales bacterium]
LQTFHENVLQNMGNGLWTTDLAGRVTTMNRAAEEITRYSRDEILGRLCFSLLPLPQMKDLFAPGRSVDLPLQIEGECSRKDGKTILIRMKISQLLEPESETKGYICVFEDLTELREMEKKIAQSEKLAEVGKISAGLAHEVRNPLASLSGSIQVIGKGLKLQGVYKRLMEIVLQETERLNAIVSDFLNYAHHGPSRNALIDFAQIIRDVITLLKNSDEYHPSITIDFKPEKERFLFKGDERQIKQMVWNLCINGLQAMSSGGTLEIQLRRVGQFSRSAYRSDCGGLVLTVRDEGCGIPEDKKSSIFDPFFTTKENGVGLGLATVSQVVNYNEGYIEVGSEANQGALFTVFLPQAALPLDEKTPAVSEGKV